MTNDQTRRSRAPRSSFGLRASFGFLVSSFGLPESFGFHNQEKAMPAGIIGRKARKNRPSRRKNPLQTKPLSTTPIAVTGASATGSVLTVTYDQAVILTGTPAYTTDVVGATALSAVKSGINTIAITFGATIAAATEMRIPYEEP